MKKIDIYTDGACSGNPGPGGWAAILFFNNQKKILTGFSPKTTNNIMEMKAVITALEELKESCQIDLYSDSKYVIDGIEKWIYNWKKNNWKTAQKKDVKNKDLWMLMDSLTKQHRINFIWVKGHDNNEFNEECDRLARLEIKNNLE